MQELAQAGATNTGRRSICCPFHEDKHPSAEIKQAPSGFWYFYCHVCDISDDVWALRARVSGRDVGEVLKEAAPELQTRPKQKLEKKSQTFESFQDLLDAYKQRNPKNIVQEVNAYTDPATGIAKLYTLRILVFGEAKKTFRQVSNNGKGWQWSGLEGKQPLFNRGRIASCEKVVIVEGEKCVREITKSGIGDVAATTSPGGAVAASKADWSPLAGKKCYIWRDNDEPGKQYESDVQSELMKLDPPALVYRVRVDEMELEPKQDVADYLGDASLTNADKVFALNNVLMDAEPVNATSVLGHKIEKIIAGEFRALPFPRKPQTSDCTKAILPGTLTTICGEPGAGKSFLVLEDFWRWSLEHNERVKLLMLEDDSAFHQHRVLAQMSGRSDILDPDYIATHADEVRNIFEKFNGPLEYFARHIETADAQMTLTEIAKWVINHAENGVRVIGVDPITAAKASDKPWIDDQKFLFEVKPVLERTGASLILTTHPRIGTAGKPSLSGMAGGASYPRFSQCVLWIKNLDKSEESRVWDGTVTRPMKHKQILQIRKARNGKGQGEHIAMNLSFASLCFNELGAIQEPDNEGN